MMHSNGWFLMGWMPLFWILLVVVALVLLFRLIGSSNASASRSLPPETAEEILKKRYARGEINKEKYDLMLEDLHRR